MCDSRLQVGQKLDDDCIGGDANDADGDGGGDVDDDGVKVLLLVCRVYFVSTVLLVLLELLEKLWKMIENYGKLWQ